MDSEPLTAFGIPADAMDKICKALANCQAVQSACIFGSRARGTARNTSDIDIALEGATLTLEHQAALANALDDLLLPWKIDLCLVSQVHDEALLMNIRQDGKVIYRRT